MLLLLDGAHPQMWYALPVLRNNVKNRAGGVLRKKIDDREKEAERMGAGAAVVPSRLLHTSAMDIPCVHSKDTIRFSLSLSIYLSRSLSLSQTVSTRKSFPAVAHPAADTRSCTPARMAQNSASRFISCSTLHIA